MRDGRRPLDDAPVVNGSSPTVAVARAVDEPIESGLEQRTGLRRTMDVIHTCIDHSSNFVGSVDDDVSPETARSITLLMARLRHACDGLESRLSGRQGAVSGGPRSGVPRPSAEAVVLSPREQQVAQLLADGYSNVNIAAVCGVTSNTVRTLMRRLYRKLGVRNRADLVREMLRLPA
jgi:DNA-binding CsgD family transcriptional regulator